MQLSSERYKDCIDILLITPTSLPLPLPQRDWMMGEYAIDQYPVYGNSDQLDVCFSTSNRVRKCVCLIQTGWENRWSIMQVNNFSYLNYVNKKACSADVLQAIGEDSLHNDQWQWHDFPWKVNLGIILECLVLSWGATVVLLLGQIEL